MKTSARVLVDIFKKSPETKLSRPMVNKNERRKTKRENLARMGLCIDCAKPAIKGLTVCGNCLNAHQEHQRELYRVIKTYKSCVKCGQPRDHKKRISCDKCITVFRENLKIKPCVNQVN